jgi:hypothetical protein
MPSTTRNGNLNQERQSHSSVQMLVNATGSDLLKAGNKAYMDLWNEKTKLEYALEAQKYFF